MISWWTIAAYATVLSYPGSITGLTLLNSGPTMHIIYLLAMFSIFAAVSAFYTNNKAFHTSGALCLITAIFVQVMGSVLENDKAKVAVYWVYTYLQVMGAAGETGKFLNWKHGRGREHRRGRRYNGMPVLVFTVFSLFISAFSFPTPHPTTARIIFGHWTVQWLFTVVGIYMNRHGLE